MTASRPASPAMETPSVQPPAASRGQETGCISGISGIPSHVHALDSPLVMALMAFMIPLIMPSTREMTPLTMPLK